MHLDEIPGMRDYIWPFSFFDKVIEGKTALILSTSLLMSPVMVDKVLFDKGEKKYM